MKPVFGFWKTFVSALKGALLSRDTLAIFAGAVAFYLIFYAWPYGNQQIEQVHILLALLQAENGLVPQLLGNMGITVPSFAAAVKA